MKCKLQALKFKYETKISQLEKDKIRNPYSEYNAGAEDICNNIIDDLEELLSVPSHETPKVRINKQTKEVCGHTVGYLDDHRDLRCTECDEPLDFS